MGSWAGRRLLGLPGFPLKHLQKPPRQYDACISRRCSISLMDNAKVSRWTVTELLSYHSCSWLWLIERSLHSAPINLWLPKRHPIHPFYSGKSILRPFEKYPLNKNSSKIFRTSECGRKQSRPPLLLEVFWISHSLHYRIKHLSPKSKFGLIFWVPVPWIRAFLCPGEHLHHCFYSRVC